MVLSLDSSPRSEPWLLLNPSQYEVGCYARRFHLLFLVQQMDRGSVYHLSTRPSTLAEHLGVVVVTGYMPFSLFPFLLSFLEGSGGGSGGSLGGGLGGLGVWAFGVLFFFSGGLGSGGGLGV